jgi:hypothetical protein
MRIPCSVDLVEIFPHAYVNFKAGMKPAFFIKRGENNGRTGGKIFY